MLLLAVMALVATVAAMVLAVGVVAARRQQAATAADLAALAAATTAHTFDLAPNPGVDLPVGVGTDLAEGCRHAETIAAANGAWLVDCHGLDATASFGAVEVTVAVDLPGLLARFGPVLVRSRAGWSPLSQ